MKTNRSCLKRKKHICPAFFNGHIPRTICAEHVCLPTVAETRDVILYFYRMLSDYIIFNTKLNRKIFKNNPLNLYNKLKIPERKFLSPDFHKLSDSSN